VDRRVPTFDDQRGRRHGDDDSGKLCSSVEFEISCVTDMALELVCSEPVGTRLEYLGGLEAAVSVQAVAHGHKLQDGRDDVAPNERTNMFASLWDSCRTTTTARHHQGLLVPRVEPGEERIRQIPTRKPGTYPTGRNQNAQP
jgi:hypothetical protein